MDFFKNIILAAMNVVNCRLPNDLHSVYLLDSVRNGCGQLVKSMTCPQGSEGQAHIQETGGIVSSSPGSEIR